MGIKIGDFYGLYIFSAVFVIPPVVKVNAVLASFIAEPFGVLVEITCFCGDDDMVFYTFHLFNVFKVDYPQLFVAAESAFVENGLVVLGNYQIGVGNFNVGMLAVGF